ncbi:H-NS histone family protein [Pelagimonas phthalicica]|uniref:H-NS histone family protein n=1 Tax=Pelagimonas phthalicica TaxID=1037362 RepID=A0A238JAA4_9RHOB|nr:MULTISPECIES: H-NS histone family protein [Roseobacteraceae]MBO9466266.1 H-NS histone family protein [Tropicibacter sp. R15_0]TDS94329.1 DNA-binding protein H-NS [Pelagimonas phthalicica]SMX27144.1 H-NS histone family protein [Pelagimonas phthalicica]
MSIDLEGMSREELSQLIADATKALKTVDARRKAEAKIAAEKVAKEFGYSLDEILNAGGKTTKGAPKYANPADPSQTWTGRGRKPKWVVDALAKGTPVEDLEI